jgi:isopropylmalate/homocitrate/citramalate synthase
MIIELKSNNDGMLGNIEAKIDLSVKDIKTLTRAGMLMRKSVLNGDYEKAVDKITKIFESSVDRGLKIASKIQSSTEEDL